MEEKTSLRDLVALAPDWWFAAEQATALCSALPLCRVRCSVNCNAVEALPLVGRCAASPLTNCSPSTSLMSATSLVVCRHF